MIDLGITPEMLKEHLILLQNPTEKFESDFKKINSKTKAAISRLYNKLNKDSV